LQRKITEMKKFILPVIICALLFFTSNTVTAQCSICTKTASQLGEKAGKGLNTGIIYLMLTPFAVGGFIGFRWWKQEKSLKQTKKKD
jgi:nucleoside recognition membrane protein YjiH